MCWTFKYILAVATSYFPIVTLNANKFIHFRLVATFSILKNDITRRLQIDRLQTAQRKQIR